MQKALEKKSTIIFSLKHSGILVLLCFAKIAFGDPSLVDVENIKLTLIDSEKFCKFSCDAIDAMLNNIKIEKHDIPHDAVAFKKNVESGKSSSDIDSKRNQSYKKKTHYDSSKSSYYNKETAEHVIKNGMMNDKDRICSWMNFRDSIHFLRLEYDTSHPIGYYLKTSKKKNHQDEVLLSHKALIILKKDKHSCSFNLLHSYPIS